MKQLPHIAWNRSAHLADAMPYCNGVDYTISVSVDGGQSFMDMTFVWPQINLVLLPFDVDQATTRPMIENEVVQ
jgi:hypothetical protein